MYRTLLARVAQRKCWLIDNYFKEYKHLKTTEPHAPKQRAAHCLAMRCSVILIPPYSAEYSLRVLAPEAHFPSFSREKE